MKMEFVRMRQDLRRLLRAQPQYALPGETDEAVTERYEAMCLQFERDAMKAFYRGDVERFFCYLDNTVHMRFVLDNPVAFDNKGIFEQALVSAWMGTRTNNCLFDPAGLECIFGLRNRDKLRSAGDPLPGDGPFVVYRGVAGKGKLRRVRGISWTSCLGTACSFALRLTQEGLEDPAVYRATVSDEDVFFYTNERKEQEFVCRPESCKRVCLTKAKMRSIADEWVRAKDAPDK